MYPTVVFIHQGTAEQDLEHFGALPEPMRSVADPDGTIFKAYKVERGGMREMFGLRAWRRGLQAALRGHFIGRKVGDPWTLPTVIAVKDHQIVWEHRGSHAGDHPDVRRIPELTGQTV